MGDGWRLLSCTNVCVEVFRRRQGRAIDSSRFLSTNVFLAFFPRTCWKYCFLTRMCGILRAAKYFFIKKFPPKDFGNPEEKSRFFSSLFLANWGRRQVEGGRERGRVLFLQMSFFLLLSFPSTQGCSSSSSVFPFFSSCLI